MDPENEVQTESNDSSVDDGLGVPYVEPANEVESTSETEPNPQANESINPAWQKVLDTLPQEFHKQVIPEFQSWDKNFAEVQTKYAPYKPLLENNVSYEDIESSIQLAKWISSDPQAVYNELGRRFGFGNVQGQEQVNPEENQEEEPEDLMEQGDPRITQLTETVQQLQNMLMQEQTQKQEAAIKQTAQAEINNEWSSLEAKVGSIAPQYRKEIIRRAVAIGDETGEYSILKGYEDYAAFVNQVRNTRANASAPRVLSGNGGQPVTKKNLGQMDEQERQDHIAAMTKALVEGS